MSQTKENFKKRLEANPLIFTKAIWLEMSNLCNYSRWHTKCPVSQMKEKTIMPLSLMEKIIKEIGSWNFHRQFSPYMYSEPLIDPRLYIVLDMFKKYVPNGKAFLVTNGFFLYRPILEELIERGIATMLVSIYDKNEHSRIRKLVDDAKRDNLPCHFNLRSRFPFETKMADLIDMYDSPVINRPGVCRAPYRNLIINRRGEIALCCVDWKSETTFGSLKEKTFKEIFTSDEMIDRTLNLREGRRDKYNLCSRCFRTK